VDRLVVKGKQFFPCCLDISEGLNNYASQLDGAEIDFHLLHLRNESATWAACAIFAHSYSPLFSV
jgi:hypothetical protein